MPWSGGWVISRGQDEGSQMHAVSLLLNTCSGMSNRVLIDDGARWILQGDVQEPENRTAGVKAFYSHSNSRRRQGPQQRQHHTSRRGRRSVLRAEASARRKLVVDDPRRFHVEARREQFVLK